MVIWDDAKQKVVITLPVFSMVRGVRFSKTHIVVALQNSIRVYNFKAKPELWHAFETADNHLGLCCLTAKILAFPGRTSGQVQIVELATGNVSIIPAHTSSLRAIDISQDGEILATASETVSMDMVVLLLKANLPLGNFNQGLRNYKLCADSRASTRC